MSEHELWNELGNLYFLQGAYPEAEHAYRQSIEQDAGFGRPYSNLALTFVQVGRYDEAVDLYRHSIELLTDNVEKATSWNRLGDVYRQLKDYAQAVVAYRRADELDPDGRVDEARPDWLARPAHEPRPEAPELQDLLTAAGSSRLAAKLQEGALRKASHPERKATQPATTAIDRVEPSYVDLNQAELIAFDQQAGADEPPAGDGTHEFSTASSIAANAQVSSEGDRERDVETIVEDRPALRYTIANQTDEEHAEVILPVRQPATTAPVIPAVTLQAGTDPLRDDADTRQIEKGIAKFQRVVQINPRNANAWDALGNLYKSAGMFSESILAYEQATALDPSRALYEQHLGLAYANDGRHEDAAVSFKRVLALEPDHPLAHAALGSFYRRMGNEDLAQKHIGKAMKHIYDGETEYNRACLAAIVGNAEEAIKLLRIALKNKQTYVDWILRDPDLDFIRQDPRFKQLIADYSR